jgi:4'-phosphopantetheinyl transferase
MSATTSPRDSNEVRVFVADATDPHTASEWLAQALAWMTADERVRFDRFRHDADRQMFALGRLMARRLVGDALGIEPTAWTWREGPHGRPEIDRPVSDLHFNLSHSAGVVICALARTRAIGVDVEHLARRTPDPAIVPRYCSPAESADVMTYGDRWCDRFLTYWTLKESYVKARGMGISLPLSDISFRLEERGARVTFERSLAGTDDRWAFHLWHPRPGHLAAVAAAIGDGPEPSFTVHAF